MANFASNNCNKTVHKTSEIIFPSIVRADMIGTAREAKRQELNFGGTILKEIRS